MSRSLILMCCLVIGLLVLACGGPTNKNGESTNSAGTSSSTAAASPVATVAAAQVGRVTTARDGSELARLSGSEHAIDAKGIVGAILGGSCQGESGAD